MRKASVKQFVRKTEILTIYKRQNSSKNSYFLLLIAEFAKVFYPKFPWKIFRIFWITFQLKRNSTEENSKKNRKI